MFDQFDPKKIELLRHICLTVEPLARWGGWGDILLLSRCLVCLQLEANQWKRLPAIGRCLREGQRQEANMPTLYPYLYSTRDLAPGRTAARSNLQHFFWWFLLRLHRFREWLISDESWHFQEPTAQQLVASRMPRLSIDHEHTQEITVSATFSTSAHWIKWTPHSCLCVGSYCACCFPIGGL